MDQLGVAVAPIRVQYREQEAAQQRWQAEGLAQGKFSVLGSVRKVAALGHAALKTGSECSCRSLHSASSPVFALPDLRSPTFRKDPRKCNRWSGSSTRGYG
ncbi:hypothetical protein C1Y34_07730 [Pseudomonas sp. GW456-L12]|nr:hypothetical protein C1Y34_07730 [Pseudomonas sp. GW456-L12]